ncbi:uncharacterized protein LOC131162431 [Malania oleifera]|uniref:uncharacterized protein LOC131162431 n=1 Tax=Malania oleifera TaxID=397392 RepID=UPI0025AE2AAA|nr:uncharacterized protein LOC131162431 [Malania oleifera]
MAEFVPTSREQNHPIAELGCSIDQITRLTPPTFAGSADPIRVENWFREIEKILVVLYCMKEQKVAYATFKFTREAGRWWESKFDRGLKNEIRKQTTILQIQDFATMVDKATVVEESPQEDTEVQFSKKRPAPLSSYSGARKVTWKKYGGGEGQRQKIGGGIPQGTTSSSACPTCGKRHSGKCLWGLDICYRCGKPGHMMRDCGILRSNAPPQ